MKINIQDRNKRNENNSSFSSLFVGDFCPRHESGEYIADGNSKAIMSNSLKDIFEKTLSVINLEAPLTNNNNPIPKSGPNIKLFPECIDFLNKTKVDVANIANNHIGDFGPEAVKDTMEILKRNKVNYVGAGDNLKDAQKALYLTKNNIKIGFLAFAENEFGIARKNKPGSSPLDPPVNFNKIRQVSSNSDITIVLIHGGNEYNPVPSPRMVKTYRGFVDSGADAVIGTHPHCPQGYEIYKDSPIFYSLGNFLFDAPENNNKSNLWWKSYMVKIEFNKTGAVNFKIIPFKFIQDKKRINILKKTNKSDFVDYIKYISKIIKQEEKLNNYWLGWCAMHGPDWLNYIKDLDWPCDIDDKKVFQNILGARNAFSCEAHNELLTTFLKMMVRDQIKTGEEYIPEIKKLQKEIIPDYE
ncbi:MAG: CapA family protein [Bacillota bacterium]